MRSNQKLMWLVCGWRNFVPMSTQVGPLWLMFLFLPSHVLLTVFRCYVTGLLLALMVFKDSGLNAFLLYMRGCWLVIMTCWIMAQLFRRDSLRVEQSYCLRVRIQLCLRILDLSHVWMLRTNCGLVVLPRYWCITVLWIKCYTLPRKAVRSCRVSLAVWTICCSIAVYGIKWNLRIIV